MNTSWNQITNHCRSKWGVILDYVTLAGLLVQYMGRWNWLIHIFFKTEEFSTQLWYWTVLNNELIKTYNLLAKKPKQ